MKKYKLIFLRSEKTILSEKEYRSWRDIQHDYDDYLASIDFESLDEVFDYIIFDYKLSSDKVTRELNKLKETPNKTIEIDLSI